MIGARITLAMFLAFLCWNSVSAQNQQPKSKPAEPGIQEDPAAKTIREAYEEQQRRERQVINMDFKNAPVAEVVEAFRQQGGINIVLDPKNLPDPFIVQEFKVVNEPFSKALEAFAQLAELSVEYVSPTLIRLSRPPRVTFNFRDADVKVVIDMIARVSGANIVVSNDVKGLISLSINNVPWNVVLDVVVKTLGFTTVKEAFGIIRIISPDELLKQLETRVFPLKYIQPPPLYSAKVETSPLIHGKPIQPPTAIKQLIERFILKQVLETVLSRTSAGKVVGKLDFDPQTNSFVVQDTRVVLDKVEEIVKLLDVEPPQVLIDAKFISTTNEDLLSFGMNYSFAGQPGVGMRQSILDPSTFVAPDGSTVTGKITRLPFGFGREVGNPGDQYFLNEWDMTMAFRAFKQDRFSRLVQEPTLAVLDNREATIFVGETISYAESRAQTNQFGSLEFTIGEASKSPVKVGFQLFVIPKIVLEGNKVILTIIPQNEFLSGQSGAAAVPGFERFELAGAGQGGSTVSIDLPRVTTNTLVTQLILESGRTAVLGGLVIERSVYEDQGIPVLKDLPVVSYLFKQRNDTMRKEHLLIFVTPRIVRPGEGPSQHLKELLRMREEAERRSFEEMKKKAVPAPAPKPEEEKK